MKKERFVGYIEVNCVYIYKLIKNVNLYIIDLEAIKNSMQD